jgi:hypothetical protein
MGYWMVRRRKVLSGGWVVPWRSTLIQCYILAWSDEADLTVDDKRSVAGYCLHVCALHGPHEILVEHRLTYILCPTFGFV